MLSFATSSKSAGASRLLTILLAGLLCLLLGAVSEANAQQLTTFTDTDAAVITTNLPPSSVMDAADYLRSKSMATALSQGPSQTASLRSGKPNILAVNSASTSSSSGGIRIAVPIAVAAAVGGVLAARVGTFGVL
ncbi:hypothetical protein RHOSPDRAFT_33185 [Rhodotorula sp. JG-1b]|nr:hypothetical protein RHOSPDRAFT_33185 [Rhodotorula sp. JG-1b]